MRTLPKGHDHPLLQTLIELLPLGVAVSDPQGRLVLRNEAAAGVAWEELAAELAAAGREGTRLIRVRCQRPDGMHRELVCTASPLPDGEQLLGVLAVLEPPRWREAPDELLVSLISHGVRTPLMVAKTNAQLIQRVLATGGRTDMAQQSTTDIISAVDRLARMLNDLLDVYRLETTDPPVAPQRIALAAYLRAALEEARPLVRTHAVEFETPAELEACTDPAVLERALKCLLHNAATYSPAGSTITVRAVREQGTVRIAVVDHGVGLPPELVPRIFERFYRAPSNAKAEGLGLGLYIAKRLVEVLRGFIEVETAVGVGSTFTIVIPDDLC